MARDFLLLLHGSIYILWGKKEEKQEKRKEDVSCVAILQEGLSDPMYVPEINGSITIESSRELGKGQDSAFDVFLIHQLMGIHKEGGDVMQALDCIYSK